MSLLLYCIPVPSTALHWVSYLKGITIVSLSPPRDTSSPLGQTPWAHRLTPSPTLCSNVVWVSKSNIWMSSQWPAVMRCDEAEPGYLLSGCLKALAPELKVSQYRPSTDTRARKKKTKIGVWATLATGVCDLLILARRVKMQLISLIYQYRARALCHQSFSPPEFSFLLHLFLSKTNFGHCGACWPH